MVKNHKLTLIPNINLISNVGNDSFASNTKKKSVFLNSQVGDWDASKIEIVQSNLREIDSGLSKKMIGIKWRHLVSPIVKFQMQRFLKLHKSLGELDSRLENFSNRQSENSNEAIEG
jgi:hypothetical protein